jgi:hypothetical protein
MTDGIGDLDKIDEAYDLSDEALEAAARVDGVQAVTIGYCATAGRLGTACRIEQRSLLTHRWARRRLQCSSWRWCGRLGRVADKVAAWIALIEVAIGEAQAGDRPAKTTLVDFLHREARRDQKAGQMGATVPSTLIVPRGKFAERS